MIWKCFKRGIGSGNFPEPGGWIAAILCIIGGTAACARLSSVETPEWKVPSESKPVLFSATKCIRAFAVEKNGVVWAATEGGIVRWGDSNDATTFQRHWTSNTSTEVRVWNTTDGMISNDIRSLSLQPGGSVVAASPSGASEITPDGSVVPTQPKPGTAQTITTTVHTAAGALAATASGLYYTPASGTQRLVPFPADSRASHVSALATVGGKNEGFLVGLYGDGVYRVRFIKNGEPRWQRLPLPDTCRFVTALAGLPAGGLMIGTRYDGAFFRSENGGETYSMEPPASLPSGDIYGIAAYRGHLYASTFDRGVLTIGENGTVTVHSEVKQGRSLVPFGDDLYALHADHSVWKFNGNQWQRAWTKNALRRADVYSMALDRTGHRLLVGGFGGWAEWNGETWQQHWSTPGLKGESITAIAADATGAVWVGTQRRGLFRCLQDSATAFQEAQGLTDDWITAIAISPKGRLLVGTYTGGILEREGDRFIQRFAADKWAMRRIAFNGETAFVATPVGLFQEKQEDHWEKFDAHTTGGLEIQALLPAANGIWIGTRNGLAFSPFPTP